MRGLIKRILNEETKVTDKINRLIHKVFPDTMVYEDHFSDYDGFGYDVRITYKLSELTKIHKSNWVGGDKPYDGDVWFDIIEMESTTQDEDNYQKFYYKDDFPEFIWDGLEEHLYGTIEPLVGSLMYVDVMYRFKTR
jgi:hypothetical protein